MARANPTVLAICPRESSDHKLSLSLTMHVEEQRTALTSAFGEILYEWNALTGQRHWRGEYFETLGYREDEIGRDNVSWSDRVHPEDLPGVLAEIEVAQREHRLLECEYRIRHRDGHYLWVQDRGVVLSNKAGQLQSILGILRDITRRKEADLTFKRQLDARESERKRAEATRETLLQLATRLSAALEPKDAARTIFAAADQLWSWDAGVLDIYSAADNKCTTVLGLDIVDGQRREITTVNLPSGPTPRTCRILKHGPELILRQPPYQAPWDAAMFGDATRVSASIMSVPVRWQGQAVGVLSIQSYAPNAFNKEDLRVLQGFADECGGTLQRLRDAEALRASEERFRELTTTIDEVFWVSDPAKNLVFYVSPAYEKIWGRSCQSLYEQARSWLEAIHPEDRDRILRSATTEQANGTYDEEYRIVRPDDSVRWIRDRAFPVYAADGAVQRIVGVARDITERKILEEQIRQSQKLEAVGQLAGGIAHDFNNILGAVLGNAQLALTEDGLSESVNECLIEIKKAAVRARDLVQQILAFSRQQPQARRLIHLGPLIDEVVGLLRATIPARIEIRTIIEPDVPPVLADPTQIHQVLINLCTNAWHAVGNQPGRIDISLHAITLDATAAQQLEGLRPGRFARLSVCDDGPGIDSHTLKHVFDPFFTTKQPGEGTGLGLSVVHGIVHDHEGVVTVVSRPGHGARFDVYLPAVSANIHAAPETHASPRHGMGQCILYLDDEESLVYLATRMLKRLGYHVCGFTEATKALEAFRDDPRQFDLVITDLNMPGASGLHVADDFLKLRPDIPIVLASGHVTEDLKKRASSAGIREVLYKPNTVEEFSEAIHRLISELAPPPPAPSHGV